MKYTYINTKLRNNEVVKEIKSIYAQSNCLKEMDRYASLIEDPIKKEQIILKNKILFKYKKIAIKKFLVKNRNEILTIAKELQQNGQHEVLEPLKETLKKLIEQIHSEDRQEIVDLTIKFCKLLIKSYIVVSLNDYIMKIKNKEKYQKMSNLIEKFQEIETKQTNELKLMIEILNDLSEIVEQLRTSKKKENAEIIQTTETLEDKIKNMLNNAKFTETHENSAFDLRKVAKKLKIAKEEYQEAIEIRNNERRKSFETKKANLSESIRAIYEQEIKKDKRIYSLYFDNNKKMLLLVGMHISELFDLHTKEKKGLFMNVSEKKAMRLECDNELIWLVPLPTDTHI